MKRESRSIALEDGTPLPANFEPGTMLIGIYRSGQTAFLYVRVKIGDYSFDLDFESPPTTRAEAVRHARGLVQVLQFPGRVQWQVGGAGAITDEPRI